MEPLHYKFDRRYNDIVLAGQRKNKKRVRVNKAKKAYAYFKIATCLTIFSASWYMCWAKNQPVSSQTPQVKAEEVASSPLTKEQGFEQVAPRDTEERERAETTEELIERYFGEDKKMALAIAKAESGLNPKALGDTNTKYPSAGLFQIRLLPERGLTKEQMFNPEENVKYAKLLHDKYGWSCWTVYKNGSYKKYL